MSEGDIAWMPSCPIQPGVLPIVRDRLHRWPRSSPATSPSRSVIREVEGSARYFFVAARRHSPVSREEWDAPSLA